MPWFAGVAGMEIHVNASEVLPPKDMNIMARERESVCVHTPHAWQPAIRPDERGKLRLRIRTEESKRHLCVQSQCSNSEQMRDNPAKDHE